MRDWKFLLVLAIFLIVLGSNPELGTSLGQGIAALISGLLGGVTGGLS